MTGRAAALLVAALIAQTQGSSLTVVRDGAVVATATDGYQDLDPKRAVDACTVSFNTDVSASKVDPSRWTTRRLDTELRDVIVRELIAR